MCVGIYMVRWSYAIEAVHIVLSLFMVFKLLQDRLLFVKSIYRAITRAI